MSFHKFEPYEKKDLLRPSNKTSQLQRIAGILKIWLLPKKLFSYLGSGQQWN